MKEKFIILTLILIFLSATSTMAGSVSSPNIEATISVRPIIKLSATPSRIAFGTYKVGEQTVTSQNIEVYCSITSGNQWALKATGNAFKENTTGKYLADNPVNPAAGTGIPTLKVKFPTKTNPSYQIPTGTSSYTTTALALPATDTTIYSCGGSAGNWEVGSGIFMSLTLFADREDNSLLTKAPAGDYRASLVLTLFEV